MTLREKVKFRITDIEPNPKEVDWWIDLSTNEYGGCIRYYREDTRCWELLNLNDQHLQQLLDYLDSLIEELEEELTGLIDSTKGELQDLIDLLKLLIQSIQELINSINSLILNLTSITENIGDILQLLTELTQRIQDVENRLTELTNNFNDYKQEVNLKLEQFETRIDSLNQTIQDLLLNITNITGSLVTLESILDALNAGTNVTLSFEAGKLKLPLWTGTLAQYQALGTYTNGVTYNIIEE